MLNAAIKGSAVAGRHVSPKRPRALSPDTAVPRPGNGRALILGLGNDILTDDAIGLIVAERLRRHFAAVPSVAVITSTDVGLGLLDIICGEEPGSPRLLWRAYDELIVVDSIQTLQQEPGCVHVLTDANLNRSAMTSPHFVGLAEMLTLGRELQLNVPKSVTVFAIEVADPFTVGTELTAALEHNLGSITRTLIDHLERRLSMVAS